MIDISWELESREHSCSKEDEVQIGAEISTANVGLWESIAATPES